MADIMLRFAGPTLVRADALSLAPDPHFHRFWEAGDVKGLSRRPSKHPGFTIRIASDASGIEEAVAQATAFLKSRTAELVALAERGASGELDFGVYVDARGSGMKSTYLEPVFLELLVHARLTLCVTSYIVTDDDDDDPSEEDWKTVQKPPG